MRVNDLMRVSVRQVIRHRRRYMGVVLAIALGVAGFLNIVTMSRQVKHNFNENLELIGGANVIKVYFDNSRAYRPGWFHQQTMAAFDHLPGVKALTLTTAKGVHTEWHGQRFGFTAVAVDGEFWQFKCGDRSQTGMRFRVGTGPQDFRYHPRQRQNPAD